jgi:hypothetical protein
MRFIFLLLLVLSPSAHAQVFGADFSLRHTLEPTMPLPLGTQFRIRLFVKNNSSFPARAAIFSIQPIPANVRPFDETGPGSEFGNCGLCQEQGAFCWLTAVIAPGGETQCFFSLTGLTATGNPQRRRWRTVNEVVGVLDPNPSDDQTQYEMRFIQPAPVPVSAWSYAMLALLLAGTGALSARRWS